MNSCDSARGSVGHQCMEQCVVVCGYYAVVRAVRAAECGRAQSRDAWQCLQQCAAVWYCGSVQLSGGVHILKQIKHVCV